MTKHPIRIVKSRPSYESWSIKISLTDRCNFRCYYCIQLPQIEASSGNQLTVENVRSLLIAARANGIRSVLWTGGEPTLGPLRECSRIANDLGFEEQGITSNGFLLNQYLDELIGTGLTRANISIDTLRPARFESITGSSRFEDVIHCIKRCSAALKTTKVNVVVMRTNLDEIADFVEFAASVGNGLVVKFHEMWKISPSEKWERLYVPAAEILEHIRAIGPCVQANVRKTNPGVEYLKFPDTDVVVGIARMPKGHLCEVKECKKLRVYPNGRTCEGLNLLDSLDQEDEFGSLMQHRETALVENSAAMSNLIPAQVRDCSAPFEP